MMSLQQNALFILLMSLGLHACATSRIADAEISSVNGTPLLHNLADGRKT